MINAEEQKEKRIKGTNRASAIHRIPSSISAYIHRKSQKERDKGTEGNLKKQWPPWSQIWWKTLICTSKRLHELQVEHTPREFHPQTRHNQTAENRDRCRVRAAREKLTLQEKLSAAEFPSETWSQNTERNRLPSRSLYPEQLPSKRKKAGSLS